MKDLFFIDGYYLDKDQIKCIKSNKNLLVIAGAGSGKTSTILGKVKYLINEHLNSEDILCISLTNEATNGLKNKLLNIGIDVDCLTFHKLGLNIINKYYSNITIVNNYLDYIVDEYFNSIVKYSYRRFYLYMLFKSFKYNEILNSKDFLLYKNTIITFINLVKNKGLDIYYIYSLYKNSLVKYNYLFILEIYKIYDNELKSNNSFDLNDLIIEANRLINNNKLRLKYKYIIIDEFQDSSKIKLNLIKNIISYNSSKIMCVGDDYQSIYRFTGSDLDTFFNFKKYFNDSEIIYLNNSYRNSSELLYVSTSFICKNKYQYKKELISNKHNSKPIKIIYYIDKIKGLKKALKHINGSYMIIGRNNKDIDFYVENNDVLNNYFTAHKSKGLESDNIIIINMTNDIMGFPNKIKNNKIISKLFDKELYKYDEERRLFYVALTRTKNNVYILVDKNNISCFVKEIVSDYKDYIEFI